MFLQENSSSLNVAKPGQNVGFPWSSPENRQSDQAVPVTSRTSITSQRGPRDCSARSIHPDFSQAATEAAFRRLT